MSSTSCDKQNSETQQLLASLEQHIAEPPPRVQPVPEDFWQQLETLTTRRRLTQLTGCTVAHHAEGVLQNHFGIKARLVGKAGKGHQHHAEN